MLRNQVFKLLRACGVDRAVGFSLVGSVWTILAGPANLMILAHFLSPEEQGFYYTFASMIALQAFFELGLGFVILQFAAHEKAHLEWSEDGTLEGQPASKARLFALLRWALLWYGVMAALFTAILLPVGLFFFARHQPATMVTWRLAWAWTVASFAGHLFLTPLYCTLEGCGQVTQVTVLRTIQSIVSSLVLWVLLFAGGKLLSAPISNMAILACGIGWLAIRYRAFLIDLARWKAPRIGQGGAASHAALGGIDWRREIWPFQWRIAVAGVSAYFIFLFFNPVLFAFYGAVAAGQMGMSLAVMNALSAAALSWVSTKVAPFGTLIAQKNFQQLDRLFFPALWRSLTLLVVGAIAFWICAVYLHSIGHPWGRRVLPPLPLALLALTTMANHIVICQAAYLRAHKEEPFLWLSIAVAFSVGLSTYFLGKTFAALGMMTGYLTVSCLSLLAATWIFQTKRRLWHIES